MSSSNFGDKIKKFITEDKNEERNKNIKFPSKKLLEVKLELLKLFDKHKYVDKDNLYYLYDSDRKDIENFFTSLSSTAIFKYINSVFYKKIKDKKVLQRIDLISDLFNKKEKSYLIKVYEKLNKKHYNSKKDIFIIFNNATLKNKLFFIFFDNHKNDVLNFENEKIYNFSILMKFKNFIILEIKEFVNEVIKTRKQNEYYQR